MNRKAQNAKQKQIAAVIANFNDFDEDRVNETIEATLLALFAHCELNVGAFHAARQIELFAKRKG